jgi:hypothetical protein
MGVFLDLLLDSGPFPSQQHRDAYEAMYCDGPAMQNIEALRTRETENRRVACQRCGNQVLTEKTELTADGALCDVCMATQR